MPQKHYFTLIISLLLLVTYWYHFQFPFFSLQQLDSVYKSANDEKRLEICYPYIRALVHSKRPEDVPRGKTLLCNFHWHFFLRFSVIYLFTFYPNPLFFRLVVAVELNSHSWDLKQKKNWMYLFAVAHFRCGEYSESANYVDKCLEVVLQNTS